MTDLSRRSLLLGGSMIAGGLLSGVAAGVSAGLLPGRDALVRLVDPLPPGVPHAVPGRMISDEFLSRATGRTTGWSVSYPPDRGRHGRDRSGHLPVLIALHGRGETHRDTFGDSLHLDRFQAALHSPFAIASVDGGDHGYWHPRRDGDPAAMVLREFLPLLAGHGLDVSRVGFFGWSMGGFGALYLGGQLGTPRTRVVVAESPALWHRYDQVAPGAFDDAADFARNSILLHRARLQGLSLRVDCGDRDGFAAITEQLRAGLRPTPAGGIEPGAHNSDYWRAQARAQLRFVARYLR